MGWTFPYPSQRMPVLAQNVVATSQPLAAQAGLQQLQQGGNAVDAALAAVIALTVVEPTSNGLGSDAFALVWDGDTLHGLNGSGRSPQAWTPDRFAGRGRMPIRGWDSVTVPGAVDSWISLWRRWGSLPLEELVAPAIHYAQAGFMVTPKVARDWAEAPYAYAKCPEFVATFLPDGRAPTVGEWFRCPAVGQTLTEIAQTQGESFYRGKLAAQIAACAAAGGGALTPDDLAQHRSEWVQPIAQSYRGWTIHEIPPNGQGLAVLITLGILEHLGLEQYPVDTADSIHLQVEAMKLGLAFAHQHICDPQRVPVPVEQLLNPQFLAAQAATIELDQVHEPTGRLPDDRGTVYVTAADAQGRMVSLIQSHFLGFGSGIVVPNTGISLQNRGFGFGLEPGHPNQVAGGKRPYHTIIPGFVTCEGQPLLSFGMVGGHMQPQGHVQLIVRLKDYGQHPQAAVDAPRWHVLEDFRLVLEPGWDPQVGADLQQRGHRFAATMPAWRWGGAQMIQKLGVGYCAASDPRKDGQAIGF